MISQIRGVIALAILVLNFPTPDYAAEELLPGVPLYNFDEIQIEMKRTACYGSCPVYSVRIEGTGKVIYHGVQHVTMKGMQETTIPDDKLVEIVNEFLRLWFFDAKERYAGQEMISLRGGRKCVLMGSSVTDLPSTVLSLKLPDRQKTVTLYDNYPPELGKLADKIDEDAGVLQWVRSSEAE